MKKSVKTSLLTIVATIGCLALILTIMVLTTEQPKFSQASASKSCMQQLQTVKQRVAILANYKLIDEGKQCSAETNQEGIDDYILCSYVRLNKVDKAGQAMAITEVDINDLIAKLPVKEFPLLMQNVPAYYDHPDAVSVMASRYLKHNGTYTSLIDLSYNYGGFNPKSSLTSPGSECYPGNGTDI